MSLAAASDPRSVAREILHERRFHRAPFPQPLRKPLHQVGNGLDDFDRWLRHIVGGAGIPGGAWVLWGLIAAVVAGATVVIARHTIQGGQRRAVASGLEGPVGDARSRRELERQADAAERAGRFEEAVRLRFGAGLLTLAHRGVIEPRPSLRTAEVAATLRSEEFETVARCFDEVVYGGRAAVEQDANEARTGWSGILREARR